MSFQRRLASLLLVAIISTACAVEKAPIYEKNGVKFGVTDGLFRSRWWNYYERGCSYAEGGYWNEAEGDFQEAIKQRDEDRRRARTYGVLNFIDYFPHREIGICYYHRALYGEAIRELERSIKDTPSAKAYYFLDKARKEWLLREGLDLQRPTVAIETPRPEEITSAFQITLCGVAKDDQFVSRVSVADIKIPVEVSSREISFCQEVPVQPGVNAIRVVAEDLVGHSSEQVVLVIADREGPQLGLEDVQYKDVARGREITVQGTVDDEHTIRRLSLNGIDVPIPPDSSTSFPFSQVLVLDQREDRIAFLAEDVAGNRNEGLILLEFPKAVRGGVHDPDTLNGLPQVAYLTGQGLPVSDLGRLRISERRLLGVTDDVRTDAAPTVLLAENVIRWNFPEQEGKPGSPLLQEGGPVLQFKDLADSQKIYFDTIYLEGNIQGPSPVTKLELNGRSVLKRQGRNLFFGVLWKLDPGRNELTFSAEDARGRTSKRTIQVEYVVPRAWRLESRLKVLVIPFQPFHCESTLGEYVSQHFLSSLVQQKRFHVVNREELDRVLVEQKLSQSELIDPKTGVKLGRIAQAEEALVGTVYEGTRSIEIFAQMVDTDTSEILLEKDVFHEDKTPQTLREITEGLAFKFKNAIPIVQGNILKVEGSAIHADIGEEEKVRKGSRVLVFRELAELVDPQSGKVIGCDTRELANAVIKEVEAGRSIGEIMKPGACEVVSLKDQVITK